MAAGTSPAVSTSRAAARTRLSSVDTAVSLSPFRQSTYAYV